MEKEIIFAGANCYNWMQRTGDVWLAKSCAPQLVIQPKQRVAVAMEQAITGLVVRPILCQDSTVLVGEKPGDDDLIIVSRGLRDLARQDGDPWAARMICPCGQVRDMYDDSIILGYQGFVL